jgi:ATP-binding cassette, subfamily F, member 3
VGTAAVAPTSVDARQPGVRLVKKRVSPEVRELRRKVGEIERQIQTLERRMEEIGAALADPKLYLDGDRVRAVASERKTAEEELTVLMRQWEELSTALAAHE